MDATEQSVVALVLAFNDALNARDLDGMMQRMTADCAFENTDPPPDGARYAGQAAVRSFWESFFRSSRACRISAEEIFTAGPRCVMRWRYDWVGLDGARGHVRGVDLYRIEDGLIAEKLSYVKG
ncbi:MAG: nuclear transport factor 2 family protein [Chloroflexi bacterium]|nr:nuclear transport factor 2 family protein [Chloroflexota bacterium]